MGASLVTVVTADLIRSRQYTPSSRRTVDDLVRRTFRDEIVRRFRRSLHTKLKFRVTAGDEFQWVMKDPVSAGKAVLALRAALIHAKPQLWLRFRAGIGHGEISVVHTADPYQEDGPAFVRARDALESLRRKSRGSDRWTRLSTGDDVCDMASESLWSFLDYFQEQWTVSQWEAVHWASQGLKREDIARRLKVRHQSVTKRLTAAQWLRCEQALDAVGAIVACTQKRV